MDADFALHGGIRFCAKMMAASAALVESVLAGPLQGPWDDAAQRKTLETAARHLHAGVGAARELMAHSDAKFQTVFSAGNGAAPSTGLMALPSDLLDTILTLVLEHFGPTEVDHRQLGMRKCCRAFEAHAWLYERRATAMVTDVVLPAEWTSDLALLPYMRAVQQVVWSDWAHAGALCAMLSSHMPALPHLEELHLSALSSAAKAMIAALAAGSQQLVALFLTLITDRAVTPLQLPHLPALRTLHLMQSGAPGDAEVRLPVALSSLTAARQLTELWVDVVRDQGDELPGSAYAATAMQPVADALALLTDLRELSLNDWTSAAAPAVASSWRALSTHLPTLPHLDTLNLFRINLAPGFDPSHLLTLSSALPRLSALRELKIHADTTPRPADWAPVHTADRRAASASFARAVGTLTALECLALASLWPVLSARDCHEHLRGLTALTQLELADLAPGALPLPAAAMADDAALIGMLAGMKRLVRLQATDVGSSIRATVRLLTEAVPALPQLQVLILPDGGADRAACLVLAGKLRDGHLPDLRKVLVAIPVEQIVDLNVAAARVVFRLPSEDDEEYLGAPPAPPVPDNEDEPGSEPDGEVQD